MIPTSLGSYWLHCIERTNDLVEGSPGDHPGINGPALRTDSHELLPKAVCHLSHPLELHSLRRDHKDPTNPAPCFELTEYGACRDCLSEPDHTTDGQSHGVHV